MIKRAGIVVIALAALALAPSAQSAARPHTKISITGPTTGLKLYTPYTYTVKIVPAQTVQKAFFRISWTGCIGLHKTIRLTAGHNWVRTFTVSYEAIRTPEAVDVSVIGLRRGYFPIASRKLTVQLEPGQAETGIHCQTYIGS